MKRLIVALLAGIGAAHAAPPTVGGCQVFPADNYWNTPIDTLPVHPSSAAWVATVGNTSRLHADWGNNLADNYGIPFTTVPASQPLVPILPDPVDDYSDESDPGPYPIPPNAPIEGGGLDNGDRHVLVIETGNCVLYELYHAYPQANGSWTASSFAKWPLNSNALRTDGWTSADAAGLPIFPGLARWEEVAAGEINHAIRFTAVNIWGSQNGAQKYLWPARHASGSNASSARPPMGARFRLKASYVIPSSFNAATQTMLRAFKKYGLVLADGGSNWFFSGVSDTNWPDALFSQLGGITGGNFEVVDTSIMQVSANSAQSIVPPANLAVTQTAAPNPAFVGKDLVYQVNLSNVGGSYARNVVLTDTLPAGYTFVWAPTGCTHASGTVTCNLGTLVNGASVAISIVARPGAPGNAINYVTATTSDPENVIGNNLSGLDVGVSATPTATAIFRYRLYSDVTKEHHFTTDFNEYTVLGGNGNWVQEGLVGKVLDNPGTFNGVTAVPYYRLYNTTTRWHHWTTDANEYYTLVQFPNWNGEGVDGYILPTDTAGATQLYRMLYAFVPGLHHWTIDANEYYTLTDPAHGWIREGGAGFVIQ